MTRRDERMLEKTYNRMLPTLYDALRQCDEVQTVEVLKAGIKAHFAHTRRMPACSDREIEAYIAGRVNSAA